MIYVCSIDLIVINYHFESNLFEVIQIWDALTYELKQTFMGQQIYMRRSSNEAIHVLSGFDVKMYVHSMDNLVS